MQQQQRRSVWTTGSEMARSPSLSPLDPLTPQEISKASSAVRIFMKDASESIRFVAVSLREPSPGEIASSFSSSGDGSAPRRLAEVLVLDPTTGLATELVVHGDDVVESRMLPSGTQPMLTPDDCLLAEDICKSSAEVRTALRERYGFVDMDGIAADPWSVHLASDGDRLLCTDASTGKPRRLVQTFLYARMEGGGMEDNHYAHPIDLVPIVDLNSGTVVRIDGIDRVPPPRYRSLASTTTEIWSRRTATSQRRGGRTAFGS